MDGSLGNNIAKRNGNARRIGNRRAGEVIDLRGIDTTDQVGHQRHARIAVGVAVADIGKPYASLVYVSGQCIGKIATVRQRAFVLDILARLAIRVGNRRQVGIGIVSISEAPSVRKHYGSNIAAGVIA